MTITFKTRGSSSYLYYRVSHHKALDTTKKIPIIIPNILDFNQKKQMFNSDMEANTKLIEFSKHLLKEASEAYTINKVWLDGIHNRYFNPSVDESETLIGCFEYFFNNEAKDTVKLKIITTLNRIKLYGDSPIKDVSIKWMGSYTTHLTNIGLSATTVNKDVSIIKQIVRNALNRDIDIRHNLFSFKPLKETIITHYLTPDELELLFDFRTESVALNNVRMLTLIGATTGLRYSDLRRVNTFEIRNGLLLLKVKKTQTSLAVPIHPRVVDFIDKVYSIESQSFNRGIKKLCKEARIDTVVDGYIRVDKRLVHGSFPKYKLISSHSLRRSFATNLYGKIPTTLIMAITSHKKESSFLRYIRKPQIDSALQLKDYYNKL